ncbi:MAG TPA: hypothetical protein PLP09_03555 [Petrotogaceae bacterium]|nr:hypothetical protein [Petrotogaceae bacterium]
MATVTSIPFAESIEHDVTLGAKKVVMVNAMAVDDSGNIYLYDLTSATVKKYNSSGVLQSTITLTEGE